MSIYQKVATSVLGLAHKSQGIEDPGDNFSPGSIDLSAELLAQVVEQDTPSNHSNFEQALTSSPAFEEASHKNELSGKARPLHDWVNNSRVVPFSPLVAFGFSGGGRQKNKITKSSSSGKVDELQWLVGLKLTHPKPELPPSLLLFYRGGVGGGEAGDYSKTHSGGVGGQVNICGDTPVCPFSLGFKLFLGSKDLRLEDVASSMPSSETTSSGPTRRKHSIQLDRVLNIDIVPQVCMVNDLFCVGYSYSADFITKMTKQVSQHLFKPGENIESSHGINVYLNLGPIFDGIWAYNVMQ